MRILLVAVGAAMTLTDCFADEAAKEPHEVSKADRDEIATITRFLDTAIEAQSKSDRSGDASEPALVKDAREVFVAFWDPKHLKRYGKHEWTGELYADAKYLIVQSELHVAQRKQPGWVINRLSSQLTGQLDKEVWEEKLLQDFSAPIKIQGTKVVRLTDSLSKQLNEFLGTDLTHAGTPNIMNPSMAKGSSRERLLAARSVIQIFPRHWGNGWHLVSHPEVTRILFDWKASRAMVGFRIGYQGGEATFEKGPDGWKMTESKITWIE